MQRRTRLITLGAAMMIVMAAFSLSGPAMATVAEQADIIVRLHAGANARLALAGGEVQALAPALDIYRWRTSGATPGVLARLRKAPSVMYAEPNAPIRVESVPNDPDYLARQWALAAIAAPQAWDIITGSSAITIAIIDTGIDLAHPDLSGKLVAGTTFVPGTSSAQDDHGHGTHVAGIAAASTNNGIGMAGVSWGAHLMPVKVVAGNGEGTYADLINGIYYAASHGAQILNMSLSADAYSQAAQDAIDYAHAQGVLLVASAGNCGAGGGGCVGVNPIMYPAAMNHVISVAATDEQDRRPAFSTYNSAVDVAAPGVGVYSTHWQSGVSTYFWMSGTSQAAPHVAGLAALIWSGRPALSSDEVEETIKNTAHDANAGQYPGRDNDLGWGRIDAQRAVDRTAPMSAVAPLPRVQREPVFNVTWSGSDENAGLRWYDVQYRDGNGPWLAWLNRVTHTSAVFNGVVGHTYYFQSRATDWAGNVEPYPNGDGDTAVYISECSLSGTVRDNRRVAVAGALLALQPEGTSSVTSDDGGYTLARASCSGGYTVSVTRDGFAALAPMSGTVLTATANVTGVDLYLPPVDNVVIDGDFESGSLAPFWESRGQIAPAIAAGQGHSGGYGAFLGTPVTTTAPGGDSALAVTVTVPVTMHRPTLSFLYRIITMDNGLHDNFEARLNGQPVWLDSYAGPDYGAVRDLGWRQGWLDLTSYAGQSIVVELSVMQGLAYASYPTGAYIDEVSVGSSAGGVNRSWLPIIVADR